MSTKENTEATEVAEETATLTATELATYLGVSPKALRRFIRSTGSACGAGNRYGFSPDEAKALAEAFANRPTKGDASNRSADEVAELLGA